MNLSNPSGSKVLEIRNLTKTFGGTQALSGVSFGLERGSIHALLGGNGSGKSTLIKLLAGVYAADRGQFTLGHRTFEAATMTPARARDAGLRFVHQQQSTFPELTVAENLAIGRGFSCGSLSRISRRRLSQRTRAVLARFHIDAAPNAQLNELSPATQSMVAIARALQDQEDKHDAVLVLDEPTASLPASEVALLHASLKRYAEAGQTILYVTHRLDEVIAIADRATVLRDGSLVATTDQSEVTHQGLVTLIMGREVESILDHTTSAPSGSAILKARDLRVGPVRSASFDVNAGEVVGLAGLLGSGRSTILKTAFGLRQPDSGTIEVQGRNASFTQPREAMAAGVCLIPEDRLGDAAFADLSVLDNISIVSSKAYFKRGRLRHRLERNDAAQLLEDYYVKAASLSAPLASLSGGNQQKVILARWMRQNPKLLLLDEPTQGVDVGARAEIWSLIRKALKAGSAALVVSSDHEELARVCDRVLILREGFVAAELSGTNLTETNLTQMTLAGSLHD